MQMSHHNFLIWLKNQREKENIHFCYSVNQAKNEYLVYYWKGKEKKITAHINII